MNSSTKDFIKFCRRMLFYYLLTGGIVAGINYGVDASSVITSRSQEALARLALSGYTVAVPENYNERVYQISAVQQMKEIPDTAVIGSSRGMYLGTDIVGDENIYNNCVSGACLEDYYGLLNLYYTKFRKFPSKVIIETSPWIFYEDNPESRWTENYEYSVMCRELYQKVNGYPPKVSESLRKESPFVSLSYFQYNLKILKQKKSEIFSQEVHRSSNDSEQAEYPDGTIRYDAAKEHASKERLKNVQGQSGAVTYNNVDNMTQIGMEKANAYENLIGYLKARDVEVILFLQPFSETQCEYSYDSGENLVFKEVEEYLRTFANGNSIKIVGGYDARKMELTDDFFIDFMHLDKNGTNIIWNFTK